MKHESIFHLEGYRNQFVIQSNYRMLNHITFLGCDSLKNIKDHDTIVALFKIKYKK